MKKTVLRIVSVIFGIVAVVAAGLIISVNYSSSGGFLDLSNFARTVYCGASIIFASLSVLTWKTDNKEHRKTKVIVWIFAIAVIIILTICSSVFQVPAVELTN